MDSWWKEDWRVFFKKCLKVTLGSYRCVCSTHGLRHPGLEILASARASRVAWLLVLFSLSSRRKGCRFYTTQVEILYEFSWVVIYGLRAYISLSIGQVFIHSSSPQKARIQRIIDLPKSMGNSMIYLLNFWRMAILCILLPSKRTYREKKTFLGGPQLSYWTPHCRQTVIS